MTKTPLRLPLFVLLFFFFNDTATTEIYTLSLHDALPISRIADFVSRRGAARRARSGDRSRFNSLCAARPNPYRQHLRPARSPRRFSSWRRIQPPPPHPENPGRLQQSLRLLRHSVRARKKSQPPARKNY